MEECENKAGAEAETEVEAKVEAGVKAEASEPKKNRFEEFVDMHGWSGSTLKLIAVVTMLIDHIGAGLLERFAMEHPERLLWGLNADQIKDIDFVMRSIGRIAFPIYCFLLVEGFVKTSNVWKYFTRLMIFGLISEVPFDLCFFGAFPYWEHQNVMFSLALGVLMLICIDRAGKALLDPEKGNKRQGFAGFVQFLIMIPFAVVAYFAFVDYVCLAIFVIFVFYLGRKSRVGNLLAMTGSCFILDEIPALAGLIPLALYNGKRGLKLKYFFYSFYPAHILLIWLFGKFILKL